jgi:hypothetical protein
MRSGGFKTRLVTEDLVWSTKSELSSVILGGEVVGFLGGHLRPVADE